jgi:hypothetical protein
MPSPSGLILEDHPLMTVKFWFYDSDREFENDVWKSLGEIEVGSIPPFADDPFMHQNDWGGAETIRGITWIFDHLTEPTLAIAALKVTRDIMLEWIKAKAGRQILVSMESQNHSIKIKGRNDIDECIKALERLPQPRKSAIPATKQMTTTKPAKRNSSKTKTE